MAKKPLTKKQKTFLAMLESNAVNISRACKKMGIRRQTHYDWIEANLTYKEAVDDLNESMIDFAEGMLYKNMKEGKESSILFFLKTRGKSRGYIERSELDISGDGLINEVNIKFV